MNCSVTVAGMRSQVVPTCCRAAWMNAARISWGTASQSALSRMVGYGCHCAAGSRAAAGSEEHTSELQSQSNLVCRLLLEKKKQAHGHLHVHSQRTVWQTVSDLMGHR